MAKKAKPAPEDRNVARLREIVQIFEDSSLCTMQYEDKNIEVQLSRQGDVMAPSMPPPAPSTAVQPAPAMQPATAPAVEDQGHVVRSPIVGTFYQAAGPGAPPFTAVGAKVTKGQTLCIIEAMKLMNEIEAEVSGTILEILVDNEKSVQYDQPLFRIAVQP